MNLIRKLFLVKEIKSKAGEVYFRRWRIISTPLIKIYFHGIYKADEDAHLHNHPWNFISIIFLSKDRSEFQFFTNAEISLPSCFRRSKTERL